MSLEQMAHYAVWILTSIYFVALLPQIWLNYKLKSTKGLNDTMLLMYLVGYLADTYYVFTLDLPIGYKIFVPAGLVATIVMIGQRKWYSTVPFPAWIRNIYSYALCSSVGLVFLSALHIINEPTIMLIGHMCGWLSTLLFGTYQIPQLLQVYQTKSVKGLSLLFIMTLGFGTALELFASLVLHLPLPSLITGLRGVIIYSLFCLFFYWYQNPNQES